MSDAEREHLKQFTANVVRSNGDQFKDFLVERLHGLIEKHSLSEALVEDIINLSINAYEEGATAVGRHCEDVANILAEWKPEGVK